MLRYNKIGMIDITLILKGFAVDTLIEEQLICDKTEEAAKFKVNPDIQFRDIKK